LSKIAFVISGKSPKTVPGGLGAYSYNVARILNKIGLKVYIIGFSSENEELNLEFATLIHFKNPYSRLLGLGAVMSASIFVNKMVEVINRELPDEVFVYSAGIWGIAGTKLKKKPLLHSLKVNALVAYFTTHKHEYQGHLKGAPLRDYGLISHMMIRFLYLFARCLYSPIERKMLTDSDKIVIHYNSTYEILLEEFPTLDKSKIVKIPYYIDIYTRISDVKFDMQNTTDTSLPTITVICRQDPRKGINTFLKAIRILKERGIKFNCLVVGSGIFFHQNKRLAAKLGLADFVNFMGFVDSVEDVLDGTDIYVLPSFEEGAGAISLLEAMKKGVAIVTSNCDGIPEDFIQKETGILVTPGDPIQLSEAIELLIRDGHLRMKLAQNVRKDYSNRFTFEKMREGVSSLVG
jgi:glycosyltransferase involved in cell wall biosynthesis